MNDEIKEKIYLERLTNPIATQKEIAAKLNLSKDMVSRGLKSLMGSHDFNLGQMLSGKFLEEFQMSSDYWKLQIKQLEDLKEDADPDTVIKIMKEQAERWEKITFDKGESPVSIAKFGRAFKEYFDQWTEKHEDGKTERVWLNMDFKEPTQMGLDEYDND